MSGGIIVALFEKCSHSKKNLLWVFKGGEIAPQVSNDFQIIAGVLVATMNILFQNQARLFLLFYFRSPQFQEPYHQTT